MTSSNSKTSAFSPRVAISLFLVGVFSFSAFITLSTFAPELMDGDDAQAHALSRSAIGYSGIVRLLKASGTAVTIRRTPPATGEDRYMVVLTPRSPLTHAEVEKLRAWRTLIILPKWIPFPSFQHKGWVGEARSSSLDEAEDVIKALIPKVQIKRASKPHAPKLSFEKKEADLLSNTKTLNPGAISELQTISGDNITPVAKTAQGETILGVIRGEEHADIYVLSDPDLLNNQGIANIDNAKAGLAILNALHANGDPLSFDVTLNGFLRSRSVLRLAFEPPLLALTLSFIIVSALIAWRAATRDGPSRREARDIAFGKRTLADNSAALFRLAGREFTMAKRYADLVRTTVAARIGIPQDNDSKASAELDRIAIQHNIQPSYSALAAQATAATSPEQALTAARQLHSWQQEIIRATR